MSSFSQLVEQMMKNHGDDKTLMEKAPKGWEGTVKAMKDEKDIDNPYALAHHMKNKGYKSHKGPRGGDKKESVGEGSLVDHPIKGRGRIVRIGENRVEVRWENMQKRLLGPDVFTFENAKEYLTVVKEKYSDDAEDVEMTTKPKKNRKNDDVGKKRRKEKVDEAWMRDIPGAYVGRSPVNDHAKLVIDLTAEDIFEDEQEDTGNDKYAGHKKSEQGVVPGVPRPSNTILTKQSDFDANSDEPLSTEDGDESATDSGPHEEDHMPDDAPKVPDYREMEDPGKGNRRETKRPGKNGKGDGGSKKAVKDRDEGDDAGKDEEPYFMKKKTNEGLSLADFDVERILTETSHMDMDENCDYGHDDDMDEGHGKMRETHDPSSEIAMTREMAQKLFKALCKDQPDDAMIDKIVDAMIECGSEKGETLDASDISKCMSKLKTMVDGGDEDEFEDRAEGDGEEAGDEAGDEHEGKTKLMADDDMDDDDDGIPDWEDEKQHTPNRATQGHRDDDKDDDDKPKPKRDDDDGKEETKESARKHKGKKKRTDESLVAMGMAGIKGTKRNPGSILDDMPAPVEDDDAEIAMIARRSGLDNWWKN